MDEFKQITADKLAYECAKLILNRIIGSRSAMADALLDYLEIGLPGGPMDVPKWVNKFEQSHNHRLDQTAG